MKTLEKGVKSVNGVNRQFTRRSYMKTIVVVLFALLMWSHNTLAQCTLGATAADAGNSVSNSGGADFGQSFTACQTGTLDKIRILNNAATTNRTVSVRDGEGLAGTILGSVTGVNLNTAGTLTDYTEIDISGEGISVTNGNSYTIEITGGLTDPYFNASAGSIYAGGQIYFGGSANADFDMIFEVDIVTGGDTDPPVFENSTPSALAVAQTEFTLSTDIDEAGNIYFVVVVDGAGTPNSSEVKAGTGSGGSGQITAGNTTVNSGGFTHDFSVSGLSANTAYDVYTVAQDDEGTPNLQASPTKIDVTTAAPIALTVTGLTGDDKAYDGTTSATASGTAALSGVVGGDDVSLTGTPTYTFASANVGTGITITTTGYTLSGTDAGKYTLTQPTLSADITAVNLTVTGLTGNDKEYDGNTSGTASGTAALSGVIGGDDVSISGSPTYTFASANVATGITITTTGYTLSGTDAGNYSLTQPTLSADITTKALTVTGLTGDDKEYDGNTTATASGTAALSGVVGGDDVSIGGSPTYTFASANIGTGISITTTGFTLSGTDAGNYSLTQPTLSADITTKALTVTGLTGDDKEYDGNTTATASGTAALSGIVGGDDVSIGGSPTYTFASANVGTGITITTTGFTLSGTDAGKYTLTQPTLSADITGANLTVTGLTGDDKTYDGTSSATAGGTAALSGVVGGDDVSLSGTPTHTFTSTDVGTGISITTTGYTLTGADAGKYSLTQPTLSADITAVDLTVTGLSGNNKTYDGGTSASASGTPSLSGIIGADDVSITGTPSYTFASVNVGTGISISTSGYALGGVDAGNYNLTQPSLSGDITAANLTVTGLTGDNKVYDGTTSASASGTPALSGVISGDDVSIGGSPTYTFASADLGADISITTTGFTLSGADAGNYTLTQPTLSADIVSPTVAFETTTGSGSESVDEEEITVVLNATMDDPVSVDYTLTGTASQGSDYTLANGTLTISSGNISNTITIADIVDDAIVETNETIIVTLSNPDNADLGTNTVYTYTIENNDAATVTITDNSIDEDDGTITLTATLDNAVQDGFTVDISTEDGTATVANNDYTAVSELTLTFAGTAGEEQTFDVSIGSDSQLESDEQFNVSMSNLQPSNLSIDISDEATVTINDDDEDMDSDGDGILDQDEDLNLNEDLEDDDTDGDGTPNYLDDDDDGDGISTLDEDFNRDGNYENDDSDNDGIPDYLDADAIPDETKIPQGISPDGDGANDIWRLPGIESHPDNKVTIFNRWGKIVYEVAGYNNSSNAFTGEANKGAVPGSGSLPDGTYYYVIDFGNGEVRKGFLLIK